MSSGLPTADAATAPFPSGSLDDKIINLLLDDVARELIITGADPGEPDSLELTAALPATLTVIDVTGYAGTFTAFMTDLDGTDVDVFLGAEDVNFSLAEFQAGLGDHVHGECGGFCVPRASSTW
jgi:hypothetical protein